MNKKLRELLEAIKAKSAALNAATAKEDGSEEAKTIAKELESLMEEYKTEKMALEAEKLVAGELDEPDESVDKGLEETKNAVDGFVAIAKMLKKQPLTETEKAMLAVNGSSGEGNLLPEDIKLEINRERKTFNEAKRIVQTIPTTELSGSMNYEDTSAGLEGLADIVDGSEIPKATGPKFRKVNFTIKFKGKIIPISNILIGAEKAGLMAYIREWFVRNAVFTENKDIFDELKKDKVAKKLAGWAALKKHIAAMDPATKIDGRIVTNATGFGLLDGEVDGTGRPMLQQNPAEPTQCLFQGLPIEVFSDVELPNLSKDHAPIFVGATHAGVKFIEYENLEFATSSDYLFNYNQTALRVIEGYDVIGADKGAYDYIDFEASPAPTPTPGVGA